jgi:hypothetical protein
MITRSSHGAERKPRATSELGSVTLQDMLMWRYNRQRSPCLKQRDHKVLIWKLADLIIISTAAVATRFHEAIHMDHKFD